MAYTSTTPALAVLEFLGWHITSAIIKSPVTLVIAGVPNTVSRSRLPRVPHDWQNTSAPASTRRIGDKWIRGGTSCLLFVPSVHLPRSKLISDGNVLVNPLHPDFVKLGITRIPYAIDPRFL